MNGWELAAVFRMLLPRIARFSGVGAYRERAVSQSAECFRDFGHAACAESSRRRTWNLWDRFEVLQDVREYDCVRVTA